MVQAKFIDKVRAMNEFELFLEVQAITGRISDYKKMRFHARTPQELGHIDRSIHSEDEIMHQATSQMEKFEVESEADFANWCKFWQVWSASQSEETFYEMVQRSVSHKNGLTADYSEMLPSMTWKEYWNEKAKRTEPFEIK